MARESYYEASQRSRNMSSFNVEFKLALGNGYSYTPYAYTVNTSDHRRHVYRQNKSDCVMHGVRPMFGSANGATILRSYSPNEIRRLPIQLLTFTQTACNDFI